MRSRLSKILQRLVLSIVLVLCACSRSEDSSVTDASTSSRTKIRIGYFPNVTHAQALIMKNQKRLGEQDNLDVTWVQFNAGPSAVEAMFSNEIDVSYIGPNPAVNGFIKSRGENFTIVAGSALGGAGLVVSSDSNIQTEKDFADKTIATPQLYNTQDVAARHYFSARGYTLKEKGGNFSLVPVANPDQLNLLRKGEIAGAWTVEPWLSRLEIEGSARLFVDEKDLWPDGKYVTTHIIMSKKFLQSSPKIAETFMRRHIDATQEINADRVAAGKRVSEQIATDTGSTLSDEIMERAMKRIDFTWDPAPGALHKAAQMAQEIGVFKETPNLQGIHDVSLLNRILKERNLPEIGQ